MLFWEIKPFRDHKTIDSNTTSKYNVTLDIYFNKSYELNKSFQNQ